MPLEITVECYAGYRGEQTPRRFHLHERAFDVDRVLDQWLAPGHRYFKVQTPEGDVCIVRHDVASGAWELTMFEHSG